MLIILALSTILSVASQNQPPFHVPWCAEQPLVWSLFQAAPPQDASLRSEAAVLHMTLRWHASYALSTQDRVRWSGSVDTVTVTNTMEPHFSWVVPGKASPALLQHEQTHFDLSEVYRRRIEARLLAVAPCHGMSHDEVQQKLDQQLHAIADAELQRLEAIHALYDAETAHGTDRAEQLRWDKQVREWLQAPHTAP